MLPPSSGFGKTSWKEVRGCCPVCGRRGWCRLSPDDAVVVCRRQDFGAVRTITYTDGSQGWLHRLDGWTPAPLPEAPRPGVPRAADADLDKIYRATLGRLRLADVHRQQLHRRGLSDTDIDRHDYHTLPAACRAGILRDLRERYPDSLLLSVPGIIGRDGSHGRYLTLAGLPGLLIPVRSVAGQVVGLVTRPDERGDGGKYRWLSSRWHGGPTPGARIHVPVGTCPGGRIIVTEGCLKADVCMALTGRHRTIIGLPGPYVTREAIDTLRALEADEVLLALDSDTATNPHVAQAQVEGLRRLRLAGFREGLLRWPAEFGKGLDDALLTYGKGACCG